ncbi:MAG: hypothetical protein JXA51_02450 [Dehalococcoidales bacterium]|nr:hypothetical protein [Dehalococcoidales bacterium]
MSNSRFRAWCIITFTMAVIAIVIRAIWQIVVIPTPKTMLIFVPLIVALIGADALAAYLVVKPGKIKSLPFSIGLTVALSAGLLAGVTHFYRFIVSTQADPFFSKVIGWLVVTSSVSAFFILIYLIWSKRRVVRDGQQKI